MWKEITKSAIRILLCLVPVPLSFFVTWKVSDLNGEIYRSGMNHFGHYPHSFEEVRAAYVGLLPCWLLPQIIILITATGFALDRKSLWGYYIVIGLNAILSLLIHIFLAIPYDDFDGLAAASIAEINRNVNLGLFIILAINVNLALLLSKFPVAQTNETRAASEPPASPE